MISAATFLNYWNNGDGSVDQKHDQSMNSTVDGYLGELKEAFLSEKDFFVCQKSHCSILPRFSY